MILDRGRKQSPKKWRQQHINHNRTHVVEPLDSFGSSFQWTSLKNGFVLWSHKNEPLVFQSKANPFSHATKVDAFILDWYRTACPWEQIQSLIQNFVSVWYTFVALNEGALKGQFRPWILWFLVRDKRAHFGNREKKENNKFAPRRLSGHIFIWLIDSRILAYLPSTCYAFRRIANHTICNAPRGDFCVFLESARDMYLIRNKGMKQYSHFSL